MRRRATVYAALAAGVATVFALAAGAGLGAFDTPVGPPMPRISSGPQHATAARSATFEIDAGAGLTLTCALDRSDYARCTSSTTYRGLGRGAHEFRVRARAAEGDWSGTASYAWRIVASRIDRRAVSTVSRPVLTTTPVRPYVSPRATFAWRAPAGRPWRRGTTFACSLDNDGWKRCRTPARYSGLAPARHIFRVRAERRSGRSRSNRFTWTIELSAPEQPTLSSAPPASTAETRVSFTFEAEGAAGFQCSLDGGNWERCASPVAYLGLDPGPHEFCVRAVSPVAVAGAASCFGWVQTAPPNGASPPPADEEAIFTISGILTTLLRPGIGGVLPLTVSNPNDFDLLVSDLAVAVRDESSRPGCLASANLQVVQSNAASGAVSILVAAHQSVTLPAQGARAPQIVMLDLPANQDACKGAVFTLDYAGTASRASG